MGEMPFATDLFPYWQSLLDSLVKVIAIIGVPYIAWRMQQAATEAEKVKKTLEVAGAKTDAQYHVIHDFLNHEKRVLLSDKAVLARERFEASKRDDHRQFMEAAEKVLADHDAGQKRVDDKAKDIAMGIPPGPAGKVMLTVKSPVVVVPPAKEGVPAAVPEKTANIPIVESPVIVESPEKGDQP